MRKPKYRKHSVRDFAFIEVGGKRIRLPGEYGSAESWEAYHSACAKLMRNRQSSPTAMAISAGPEMSVAELCVLYVEHARAYYKVVDKRGETTMVEMMAGHLIAKCGHFKVSEFGARRLKEFRDALAKTHRKSRAKPPKPDHEMPLLSASYVNSILNRVRRMYRWAVIEEIVTAAQLTAIRAVQGLPVDMTDKAHHVPISHVAAVIRHMPKADRKMVVLQARTGVRSRSICLAKPEQFDTSVTPWLWRPRHKQERKGQKLVVPIGPRCRRSLRKILEATPPGSYLFPPSAPGADGRKRPYYSAQDYGNAIKRAIKRANRKRAPADKIPHWSPHRLRHSLGDAVRQKYGAEAAQAILGHSHLNTTELYSSPRLGEAKRVAEEIG